MRTPAAAIRRLKRREPGVYWYITRRHLSPWRTEFGYAGKARNLTTRGKCHEGTCHHAGCEATWAKNGIKGALWYDLKVKRRTIRLPWWLGFDFITLSLETLVILTLRPRYNWQKNPRRDKAGPKTQRIERWARDRMPDTYRAKVQTRRVVDLAVRWTAALLIITGIGGYLWTR